MRPEIDLLLETAAASPSVEKRQRAGRLLSGPLDWSLVVRLAQEQRVQSLLYRSLRHHRTSLPGPARESLRAFYHRNLAHNLALKSELLTVLAALEKRGIDAIPYKGPVLAETAYGDLALRQFTDLDVLVRERDVDPAMDALSAIGYRPFFGHAASRSAPWKRYVRDISLQKRASSISLELQWRLAQRYHPAFRDMEDVWTGSRAMSWAGRTIRTLSTPDLLLALCLHGTYHSWVHLQLVVDIAEVLRSNSDLDGGDLVRSAQRQGSRRALLFGLLLARKVLGVSLPGSLTEEAERDSAVVAAAERTRARFFERRPERLRSRSHFFLEARLVEGPGRRLRYVLGRIMTPNEEDRAARNLPPGLFWFYPLFRGARLVRQYWLGK